MRDLFLLEELLCQIEEAVKTIRIRFEPVESVDWFLDSPEGQEKLDSICMLFIAIGEGLKQVDKLTDNKFLKRYDNIDWRAIKGMRDILSHHYFDLNAEAVFNVCNDELLELQQTLSSMIEEIHNNGKERK